MKSRRKTIKIDTVPIITLGQVVDANDPKQMGRVRILCTALGDTEDMQLANLPWANYVSPLAGVTSRGSRGREDDTTFGPIAYGMWNIPKVGALALVACLDGDPRIRVYFGQMHGELLTHTLPHGRFSVRGTIGDFSDETLADLEEDAARPVGPFNSREEVIQPQFDKLIETFTAPATNALNLDLTKTKPQRNYEYFSRGADNQVSRLSESDVFEESIMSFARDDLNDPFHIMTPGDADDSTQGYQHSRIQPNTKTVEGTKVYDSQIYSWTTPGLHALAMDDAPDNCRMRFRTTHGHQIILDDTNERIYISTAGGKTWVELDEKGNIDYYAERNISFHAGEDFNITAKNIRMKADEGIHMISEGQIRMHSILDDIHMKSDKNIRFHSGEEMRLQSIGDLHVRTEANSFMTTVLNSDVLVEGSTLKITASTGTVNVLSALDGKITSDATLHLKGATDVNIESGTTANIKSATVNIEGATVANVKSATVNMEGATVANVKGAAVNVQASGILALIGATINLNSGGGAGGAGSAGTATAADSAIAAMATIHKNAFWTNRVPEHEPWPRVMTQEFGTTATDNDGPDAPANNDLNTHTDAAEYPYVDDNVGKVERGFDMTRNKNWKR